MLFLSRPAHRFRWLATLIALGVSAAVSADSAHMSARALERAQAGGVELVANVGHGHVLVALHRDPEQRARIGNALGYALSGKRAAAYYNTEEFTIFDQHVFALAGDGCIQEGVTREAYAGALRRTITRRYPTDALLARVPRV